MFPSASNVSPRRVIAVKDVNCSVRSAPLAAVVGERASRNNYAHQTVTSASAGLGRARPLLLPLVPHILPLRITFFFYSLLAFFPHIRPFLMRHPPLHPFTRR